MAASRPMVRDERLCWLAVEDRLRRRSQRLGVLSWLIVLGSAGLTLFAGRARPAARMRTYSVAVDHVATFLDDEERSALRSAGAVPPWFLYEVSRVSRAVRRDRPLPSCREDPGVRRRRAIRLWVLLAVMIAALSVVAGATI